MNEQQIVDYLRARGQVTPPVDFTRSVMAAVDSAPAQPSRFSAYLPAFAAVGAAAVVAVLALLVGPGRDIGPAPSPSATAETATVDELRVALMESVDVLRDAPGVEGRQQAEIDGTIGTATWFDWLSNGDQVVVTRHDLDVTETGWWMVPDGAPSATGQRIYTNIQAKIGEEFYFINESGDWEIRPRNDQILAMGTGILDGSILPWYPLMGLAPSFPDVPETDARVERGQLPDGGVTWQLEFQWDGTPLIQSWTIGPGGELRSWSMDREGRSVDPEGGFHDNATHVSMQFTITDGEPIAPPDVDAVPDTTPFGLPEDFPLGESPRRTGGLEAAVAEAVAQLGDSPGVQGVVTSTIGEYVGSATWFDWRPNGDQVVVTRTDIDVSAPWWTDPDGQPLTVAERIETDIAVAVGDDFYRTDDDTWLVEEGTRPLNFWTGVLERRIPAVGGFPADAQANRRDLAGGTTVWVMVSGSDDGRTITEWTVDPDGFLASVSVATEQAPTPEQAGSTTTTVEFTPLDDVGLIPVPDLDAAPDARFFGTPADLPLQPMPTPPTEAPLYAVRLSVCPPSSAPFIVTLPDGWWTNTAFEHPEFGEIPACQYFAPNSFDATSLDRDQVFPEGVAIVVDYIDGGCIGSFLPMISSRETTVDGHPASVAEYARTANAGDPPGRYEYVVNLAPGIDCEAGGRYILAATDYQMAGDYETNKAFLDEMMSTIQIEE